MHQSP
ncbi:hypothetical protein YPPY32_2057, partial [Yersinia pestis PY-32]